jgi:hypothetical protein
MPPEKFHSIFAPFAPSIAFPFYEQPARLFLKESQYKCLGTQVGNGNLAREDNANRQYVKLFFAYLIHITGIHQPRPHILAIITIP